LFGVSEYNSWGGCHLDHKQIEAKTFPAEFLLGIFRGGLSHYAATPLNWLLLFLRVIVI
jgi:hypothetical protein